MKLKEINSVEGSLTVTKTPEAVTVNGVNVQKGGGPEVSETFDFTFKLVNDERVFEIKRREKPK